MRAAHLLLAMLLTAVPFVDGWSAPTSTLADADQWSARLLGLSSTYGNETWKYDLAYEGQTNPNTIASHAENRTTSYYGAVGLQVGLRAEIFEVTDPERDAGTEYNVSAFIPTSRGPIYAYVKREGTSRVFQLDFDLDGANNVDPFGRSSPPADPGPQIVQVTIQRRFANPPQATTLVVGAADFTFTYELPTTYATVAQYVGLPYIQPVPDEIFRLYNDVGWDRSVYMLSRPINATTTIDLEYQFAAAINQTVRLDGLVAVRSAPSPLPPGTPAPPAPPIPPIPGVTDNETVKSILGNLDPFVVIQSATLAASATDDAGRVRFQVTGAQLAGIANPPQQGAFVVLAPVLEANFDPSGCTGDCKGGPQYRVGATELVAPVTERRAEVHSYFLTNSGVLGNTAPPPIRDVLLGVNELQVFVQDLNGFGPTDTRDGDLYAVVADGRSVQPLSSTGLSKAAEANLLSGRMAVKPIQDARVSYYRVFAFLYTDNDAFYGITYGDRGFDLTMDAPVTLVPPGEGGVDLAFTSHTTNYDLGVEEQAFQLRVFYQVQAPDLGINESRSIVLKEIESGVVFFPINLSIAGQVLVTVDTTTGDTHPASLSILVRFEEAPEDESLVDKIPGFEAPLLLLGAALVATLLLRRRR